MNIFVPIVYMLVSYLIGSLPMSIIVGKITKGIDVRDYGSGNPGTTNAIRVLGRPLGMVVFFLDVLKGGIVILIIRIGLLDSWIDFTVFHPFIFALFVVLGHIYPVFLKFKGGKAVATGVGVFLFYAPVLGVIGLLTYLLGLKLTRYVSVGSCSGASVVFISTVLVYFFGPKEGTTLEWLFSRRGDIWIPIIGALVVGLILYRHRGNFKRIIDGTEPKSNFMQPKHKHI